MNDQVYCLTNQIEMTIEGETGRQVEKLDSLCLGFAGNAESIIKWYEH